MFHRFIAHISNKAVENWEHFCFLWFQSLREFLGEKFFTSLSDDCCGFYHYFRRVDWQNYYQRIRSIWLCCIPKACTIFFSNSFSDTSNEFPLLSPISSCFSSRYSILKGFGFLLWNVVSCSTTTYHWHMLSVQ